jgi:hypothetical protein
MERWHLFYVLLGQPVKYKLKPNTGITSQWLLTNVFPSISKQYEDDAANMIADVLALPLLFAVMEPGCQDMVTLAVFGRVCAAWTTMCVQHELQSDWNPVEKVVIQVHCYENQLVIDELLALPGGGGGNNANGVNNDPLLLANQAAGNQQQIGIMTNQLHQLKQELSQAKMETLHAVSELRSYCTD